MSRRSGILLRSLIGSRCHRLSRSVRGISTTAACAQNAAANMEKVPSNAEDVYVHKYVERSPSEILRVLHSTARSECVPPYPLLDDPYLMPVRSFSVITCQVSHESGRNAARWVRDTNPEIFQQRVADPFCDAYLPRLKLNENTVVDLNMLTTLIRQFNVSDAITAYKKLKETNAEVPLAVLHELLDLLCFFNAEDDVPEQNLFERSYMTDKKVTKWHDNGVAEDVFNDIKPVTARAFCTLIKGMHKHGQFQRAEKYWQEMQTIGLPADPETYHAVISDVFLRSESAAACWEDLQTLLTEMAARGIPPCLVSLNASLQALSTAGSWSGVRGAALDVWCEMTRAGVVPSIGSYSLLIQIFHESKSDQEIPDIIQKVLDILQGQSLSPRHLSDLKFFALTMKYIRRDLHDPDALLRLDQLLTSGDNISVIGTKLSSDSYYRTLVCMLAEMLAPSDFMENHYRRVVPFVYSPEPKIMQTILASLSVGVEGARYYSELWSDCVRLDLAKRGIVAQQMLLSLVDAVRHLGRQDDFSPDSCEPPVGSESAEAVSSQSLRSQLTEIGWNMFAMNELDPDRPDRMKFPWTASMLGDVLFLQCEAGRLDRAEEVFSVLDGRQASIVGVCSIKTLELFHELAMKCGDANAAVKCVLYSSQCGFNEAHKMADALLSSGNLNEMEKQQLSSAGFCSPPNSAPSPE